MIELNLNDKPIADVECSISDWIVTMNCMCISIDFIQTVVPIHYAVGLVACLTSVVWQIIVVIIGEVVLYTIEVITVIWSGTAHVI